MITALQLIALFLSICAAQPPAQTPAPAATTVATAAPTPVASPTPEAGVSPVPPASTLTGVPIVPAGTSFLDTFPALKNYVYEEPASGFYLGLGLSPIGLLRNQFMFTGNFFELHWIKDNYDIEILNAAYSSTRGQSSEFQSTHFTFRAAPKYKFFGPISAGPLVGYELVSFPGVGARIYRAPYIEPNSEPFSSRGWIYGGEISETFTYGKGYILKFNELFYQETYSVTSTIDGWDYRFDDQTVQNDRTNIAPGFVIMFEGNLLY